MVAEWLKLSAEKQAEVFKCIKDRYIASIHEDFSVWFNGRVKGMESKHINVCPEVKAVCDKFDLMVIKQKHVTMEVLTDPDPPNESARGDGVMELDEFKDMIQKAHPAEQVSVGTNLDELD